MIQALMKTVRRIGNVDFRNILEPIPGPEEFKVWAKIAGIYRMDVHIVNDEFP